MTSDHDEHQIRTTEHEAQANLKAVLQLCAAGRLRCSEKTLRPSTATVKTVAEALSGGDFYAEEPIASFAWPLLLQAGGLAELTSGKLALTALDLAELRHHLSAATTVPLPRTVTTLLADAARRVGQVRDTGPVHLVECADPAVAALLATDRRTRTHCTRLGERHLAVPLDKLPAFRKSALAQGYPVG